MKNKRMTVENIDGLVAKLLFFGLKIEYNRRSEAIMYRKKIVCFLAFKIAKLTKDEIAEFFGDHRDNIIAHVHKAEELFVVDPIFHHQIRKVIKYMH